MNPNWLHFVQDLEARMRSFLNNELPREIIHPLRGLLSGGPKVEVLDQGGKVKVIIEAPGFPRRNGHRWAFRVLDQTLYVRGSREEENRMESQDGRFYSDRNYEEFVKAVPLPSPVKRKPASVYYRNGLLHLVFYKNKGKGDDSWIELEL